MEKLQMTRLGRPQRKERPRAQPGGRGRSFTPPDTRRAEAAIVKEARALLPSGFMPWIGPVKLTLIAVYAIPSSWPKHLRERAMKGQVWHIGSGSPDLDNIIKLYTDALNGVVYHDDSQIAVSTCGKRYGHPERVELTLELLDQPPGTETPGQVRRERDQLERAEQIRLGRLGRVAKSPKTKSEDR